MVNGGKCGEMMGAAMGGNGRNGSIHSGKTGYVFSHSYESCREEWKGVSDEKHQTRSSGSVFAIYLPSSPCLRPLSLPTALRLFPLHGGRDFAGSTWLIRLFGFSRNPTSPSVFISGISGLNGCLQFSLSASPSPLRRLNGCLPFSSISLISEKPITPKQPTF